MKSLTCWTRLTGLFLSDVWFIKRILRIRTGFTIDEPTNCDQVNFSPYAFSEKNMNLSSLLSYFEGLHPGIGVNGG